MDLVGMNFEDVSALAPLGFSSRGAELPVPGVGHFGLAMLHNQTMMPMNQSEIFSPPSLPQTPFNGQGFNFLPDFNFMNINFPTFAPSEGLADINPVLFQSFMDPTSGIPTREFGKPTFTFKTEPIDPIASIRTPGRKPYIDPNLSDDEKERREKRRQRNKEAAARCRQRRLDLLTSLTASVEAEKRANAKKEDDIIFIRSKVIETIDLLNGMKERLMERDQETMDRIVKELKNTVVFNNKFNTDALKGESQTSPINLTLPKLGEDDSLLRPGFLDLNKQPELFRMPMTSFGSSLPSITSSYGFNQNPMMLGSMMNPGMTPNGSASKVICEL